MTADTPVPCPYCGALPIDQTNGRQMAEEAKFRKWAREHWTAVPPENLGVFHPVVRDEWQKIDEERGFRWNDM